MQSFESCKFKLMGSAGEPEPVQQFQLTHDISELWLCRLVISLPYSRVCALSSWGCTVALVSIKRIKGAMLTIQDSFRTAATLQCAQVDHA